MHRLHDSRARPVGRPAPTAPRTVRAGDDDRRRVQDLLQAHYVAGRLTSSELEDRIEQAVGARTLGDLDALLADLPTAETPSIEDAPPDGTPVSAIDWHGVAHHGGKKSFRAHALSYLLVMAMLVAIWALTTPGGYFWPIWPMLGWGIGLASHGLGLRAGRSGQWAAEVGRDGRGAG